MTKCKICGTETDMPFHTCNVPVGVAALRAQLEESAAALDEARIRATSTANLVEGIEAENDALRAELESVKQERDAFIAAKQPGNYCVVNAEYWFALRGENAKLREALQDYHQGHSNGGYTTEDFMRAAAKADAALSLP